MGDNKHQWNSIFTAYTIIFLCGGSTCLKIVGISVPELAYLQREAHMSCSYDTGQLALFSVKWYKDEQEFYRFMPSHKPRVLTFHLEGGVLSLAPGDPSCSRTSCSIVLEQLTPAASGSYTCEVSTEAPTFRTAMETRNMSIMTYPPEEPQVENLKTSYSIGDLLNITCRSAPSTIPSQLSFFLNGEEVTQKEFVTVQEDTRDGDMLRSAANLKVYLSRVHFRGRGAGTLAVRCTATLGAILDSARSFETTVNLISPMPLHNQKLEWPSSGSSGKILTVNLLLWASSIILTLKKMF